MGSSPLLHHNNKTNGTQQGTVCFVGGEDDVKDELLISLRETFFDLFL